MTAPESVTLLPCPFCALDSHLSHGSQKCDGEDAYSVWCNYCGMVGPWDTVPEKAIAAWNTRQSAEAASREREARLVEALHLAASRLQVASVDAIRVGETRLSADCITWANDATRAALAHRSQEGEASK